MTSFLELLAMTYLRIEWRVQGGGEGKKNLSQKFYD